MSESATDNAETDDVEEFKDAVEKAHDHRSALRGFALIWDACTNIERDTKDIEYGLHERISSELTGLRTNIDRMEEAHPATNDD